MSVYVLIPLLPLMAFLTLALGGQWLKGQSGIIPVEAPFSIKLSVGAVSAAIILLGLFSDPIVRFLLDSALPSGL